MINYTLTFSNVIPEKLYDNSYRRGPEKCIHFELCIKLRKRLVVRRNC
jgi:hypothetical protein